MDNLKFVSNNVNGLSTSDKDRIKIFLYLQNTIKNNGILFLQETHSTTDSAQKYKKDFCNYYICCSMYVFWILFLCIMFQADAAKGINVPRSILWAINPIKKIVLIIIKKTIYT
jgi:hypothetical protein